MRGSRAAGKLTKFQNTRVRSFFFFFFFVGITLSGANASEKWESPKQDEEGVPARPQRLVIKNLLLGHEAKANEYSVVEAQAPSAKGEVVKIPIAVLKVGETRSMNPHLEFPDGPVTFKLISGSGPVHIHGLLGVAGGEEMEELELEEMNEESEGVSSELWSLEEKDFELSTVICFSQEDDLDEEENGGPKKKIKLANNGKAGKKK